MGWLDSVSVGDWVEVEIINPHGDRNLDGGILKGTVTEIVGSPHYMVRLDTGWCAHSKDRLLEHRPLVLLPKGANRG